MIMSPRLKRWLPFDGGLREIVNNRVYAPSAGATDRYHFNNTGITRSRCLTFTTGYLQSGFYHNNMEFLSGRQFTITSWVYFTHCWSNLLVYHEAGSHLAGYMQFGIYGHSDSTGEGSLYVQYRSPGYPVITHWTRTVGTNLNNLTNQWVHLAIVNRNWHGDGNIGQVHYSDVSQMICLYINGRLDNVISYPPTYSTYQLIVPKGIEIIGTFHYVNNAEHRMQNVRFYDYALTHNDIRRDMFDFHPLSGGGAI